jgi:hypothetical protein
LARNQAAYAAYSDGFLGSETKPPARLISERSHFRSETKPLTRLISAFGLAETKSLRDLFQNVPISGLKPSRSRDLFQTDSLGLKPSRPCGIFQTDSFGLKPSRSRGLFQT